MRIAEATISYKHPVPPSERPKVTGSRDCYEILLNHCYDDGSLEHRERFIALFTNQANRVISWITIGIGGIDSTTADVRIILQAAILCNASGIVLSHNHPSGNLKPSEADIRITHKIKSAAALMDIRVLDHLIVTPYDFYSFADAGQI
jgi:DNA repair protein RadC